MRLALILLLLAGAAGAGCFDPPVENDVVGLFFGFDQNLALNCADLPRFSSQTVYLVLWNPSGETAVTRWELVIDWDDGLFLGDFQLHGGGSDLTPDEEYRVHLSEPLPVAPFVVLAEADVLVFDIDAQSLYIRPVIQPAVPDAACYWDASGSGEPIPLKPWPCNWDSWAAVVNPVGGCWPLPTEPSSWGRIKALY